MKKFSNIVEEISRVTSFDSTAIMQRELSEYTRKMKSKLPKDLQVIMILLNKYGITAKEAVESIAALSKSEYKIFAAEHNMEEADVKMLQKLLEKNDAKLRMLPMFQTDAEREAILAGKLAMDDMTMDLESEVGRTAVVKQYMPLVIKIAKQFVGKSNLDFKELYSAGMLGLTLAMNSYRKPKELDNAKKSDEISSEFAKDAEKEQKKTTSFLTWASYMIRAYILEDIKNVSRTVRVPVSVQSAEYKDTKEKTGTGSITKSNTVSTDDLFARSTSKKDNDGGKTILDLNPHLNTNPDEYLGGADSNRLWKHVYELIEKRFKQRDVRIFYRFLGLNGFEKMKNSEISKREGISASNVTFIVKSIIDYLKTDKLAMSFLEEIYDRMVSNESFEFNN